MASVDPDRARAARVAARSQLRDIRLLRSSFELGTPPDRAQGLGYDLNIDAKAEWEEGDTAFAVRGLYELRLTQLTSVENASGKSSTATGDDAVPSDQPDESEQEGFAAIEFTLIGVFTFELREGDDPVTSEELAAYAVTTGSFALYPFAREYIRDVTSRMGIPQPTLGVALQPVTRDETGGERATAVGS